MKDENDIGERTAREGHAVMVRLPICEYGQYKRARRLRWTYRVMDRVGDCTRPFPAATVLRSYSGLDPKGSPSPQPAKAFDSDSDSGGTAAFDRSPSVALQGAVRCHETHPDAPNVEDGLEDLRADHRPLLVPGDPAKNPAEGDGGALRVPDGAAVDGGEHVGVRQQRRLGEVPVLEHAGHLYVGPGRRGQGDAFTSPKSEPRRRKRVREGVGKKLECSCADHVGIAVSSKTTLPTPTG
jgi:hypothetical protein